MNNAEAVALRDWLEREGWKDEIFLDLDPNRGIAAGERWERALHEAANRCEAVLFLVSKAWIASGWCRRELSLAHRLDKRLFGVLIEDLAVADVPRDLSGNWQLVRLATGRDHVLLRAVLPVTHEEVHVTFSAEGLQRLKHGLEQAGLDARHFAWPPSSDPNRPPYRGLRPLEADDAGIFFGRDAPVINALDRLRGMREAPPPRLLVILGASGSGKSSFLRAGLLPRLARDDRNFLPLPIVRPERAAIFGETGFLRALERAFQGANIATTRASLRAAIEGGAAMLRPLLQTLVDKGTPTALDIDAKPKPPTLIMSIDQAEELFLAEGQDEARGFLALLRELLVVDAPALTALFTIRSDSYEPLQLSKDFEGVRQETLSLPPMPKGSYADVIKGPARRLDRTARPLTIEDALVDMLLVDVEAGGGKDALPLLAFTLERLYVEHGGDGDLRLAEYRALGGIRGSIEAAVERALRAADASPAIPKDPVTRLALLRRGLVPWLAGIDPDTGAPRRRVARLSEIPTEARPLIQHLVEQRLLTTDVARDTGENTIEPAHEALLRQWGLLQGWLAEDSGLLSVMDGVKRASRDWAANGKNATWLTHATGRLEAAKRLTERPDLAANLGPTDREYLATCRNAEAAAKGSWLAVWMLISMLFTGLFFGLVFWVAQPYLDEQINWFRTVRPYMLASVRPYVLTAEAERALKPQAIFRECAKDCPEMIVIPAGEFTMGSPATEEGRSDNEGPQHKVTIAKPFAVSKFDVTFADWDACVSAGGCPQAFGPDTNPVINVSWDDAQRYVAWFSKMTGKPYRLLTEAEWEYAARAGTTTAYFWGDEIVKGKANCSGCGNEWDRRDTSPVGSFKPNAFGLYDMAGNVWQWVQDCYHGDYNGVHHRSDKTLDDLAPTDGSAWTRGYCFFRVVRGGSRGSGPQRLRSAARGREPQGNRYYDFGFRVGRTLTP
jgi:formylglycine-generating enzyme required for sulfatase activity